MPCRNDLLVSLWPVIREMTLRCQGLTLTCTPLDLNCSELHLMLKAFCLSGMPIAGSCGHSEACQRSCSEAAFGKADECCYLHPSTLAVPSNCSQVWCALPGHLALAGLGESCSCQATVQADQSSHTNCAGLSAPALTDLGQLP